MSPLPTKRPRVRQACTACRESKFRCDLGDPLTPKDPPCQRCERTGRSCEFVGSHLQFKPRKMTNRRSGTSRVGDGLSGPSGVPQASKRASISPTTASHNDTITTLPYSQTRLGSISGHLETPADALRILCAAASDERAATAPPSRPFSPTDNKIWNRWEPVRDGLLTADEAKTLQSL